MTASRRAVVIGAGITGVLVARELLLAGWQVTVLEGRHVGSGSSSRTAAGIRQQFSSRATVVGMRYAVQAYQQLARETEDGVSPIQQNGYLFLYSDDNSWLEAVRRVAWQRSEGLADVEALGAAELAHRFRWVNTELCLGGTWCPTDGFLRPAIVYMEGARRVRELGGALLQGATVLDSLHRGDQLVAVRTPEGLHEADLFIDCTNAWTRRLARCLHATDLPVQPLKRYLWFIERGGSMTAETLASMPLVISPSGVYGRPENPGSLLMGWKHEAEPEPEFTEADQDVVEPRFSHDTGLDARPFEAWMQLAQAVPAIGDFDGISATTAGYYATTPDHHPFLGFDPGVRNLIRLVGFSGHGAMMGPFTAAIAAALAEAGRDLPSIELPTGTAPLGEFAIGRAYADPERLVI